MTYFILYENKTDYDLSLMTTVSEKRAALLIEEKMNDNNYLARDFQVIRGEVLEVALKATVTFKEII